MPPRRGRLASRGDARSVGDIFSFKFRYNFSLKFRYNFSFDFRNGIEHWTILLGTALILKKGTLVKLNSQTVQAHRRLTI